MRIAFFVCPEQPVPPIDYGGAEKITSVIVPKLLNNGIIVDLYAGPGSTCQATNLYKASQASMANEHELFKLMQKKNEEHPYHCIIDYSANHLAGRHFKNVVSIMGGDPYKKYPHDDVKNRVYVSQEFAIFNDCPNHPYFPCLAIESNPNQILLGTGAGNYILYVGIIHPMKGVELAITACSKLNKILHVAGPIRDKDYWNKIKHQVKYLGIMSQNDQDNMLGNARVFVHPVQVCDANPLTPREAMLRGTPVVANPSGGICSAIVPGISGYFTQPHNPEDFANAIKAASGLDRYLVRQLAIVKNNPDIVAMTLASLCSNVMNGKSW